MIRNNLLGMATTLFCLIIVASCGSKSTSNEQDSETEEANTTSEENVVVGADAELEQGQSVFFVNIEDGATVASPVTVEMGVNGMGVEPAGELSLYKGHHHIIVNGEVVPKGEVVPTDSTHIHFGQGQTSASLELQPGRYNLRLQFADGVHRSYGPQMSTAINIVVE